VAGVWQFFLLHIYSIDNDIDKYGHCNLYNYNNNLIFDPTIALVGTKYGTHESTALGFLLISLWY